MANQHFLIHMRSYRIVGAVAFAIFAVATVAAIRAHQQGASLMFLVFALLGIYIVLGAGAFEINDQLLSHRSAFGEWQMAWSEVVAVEVGEADGTLVFFGANKRFVLSSPSWWSGPDRESALTFLLSELAARNLKLKPSRTAAYKIMRNTRVRRTAA